MAVRIEELNDTNCKTYLLTVGDEAALVDPVRERLETYRLLLGRRGLKLRMVLETHMHADHLMLNRASKDLLGATLVMHRESPSPLVDRHVDDGDVLTLGGERIEVLHTPGHTPDSVCYRLAGAVLTGDTLMVGGSGRTDFPGGDAGQQYDAVVGRLFTLPDDTLVWPGHDYQGKTSTTIGEEKRTNPRYAGRSRAEYVTLMGSLGLPFPEKVQQSLQVNQSGFETEEVHFPMVADIAAMPVVSPEQVAAEQQGAAPPLLLDVREPEEPGVLLLVQHAGDRGQRARTASPIDCRRDDVQRAHGARTRRSRSLSTRESPARDPWPPDICIIQID